MGNTISNDGIDNNMSIGSKENIKRKFNNSEIHLLKETFRGLANRTDSNDLINKDTFLQYLSLPGHIGERLFSVFDKRKQGFLGFEEFINGLSILYRGSKVEKMHFIFDVYDIKSKGFISEEEWTTMLNQLPIYVIEKIKDEYDIKIDENDLNQTSNIYVEKIVKKTFDSFHLFTKDENTGLSFEQFNEWCTKTPAFAEFIFNAIPYPSEMLQPDVSMAEVETSNTNSGFIFKNLNTFKSKPSLSPKKSQDKKIQKTGPDVSNLKIRELLIQAKHLCTIEKVNHMIEEVINTLDNSNLTELKEEIENKNYININDDIRLSQTDNTLLTDEKSNKICGILWKIGKKMRQMKQRYYILDGNFLYYYNLKEDVKPRGVIFLSGSFIDIIDNNILDKNDQKGIYYGFEISISNISCSKNNKKKIFYTKNEIQRNYWIQHLKKGASCCISFDDKYIIKNEISDGKFSFVYEAIDRETNDKVAVKKINKNILTICEKELLRTEIAVLKMVHHPNIIQMLDIYEDKEYIYIVMELLTGGELFHKIVSKVRYNEDEARNIILPILKSVAYLHSLGITHRDIKPENILCGDKIYDIKIADFGLSKLVLPNEILTTPCGTLTYVAPEVLAMQGYNKEADLWSVGVILFLLLRGKLPFDGKTKNELIQQILNSSMKDFIEPSWSNVSQMGKNLLEGLLDKDPNRRFTAKEALQHPWFL